MLKELVKVGLVTQIYPERGSVRVNLTGVDDSVSYELPVIYRKTLKDKDYWMPDVGEQVVCLFSGEGLEQGFVLGAIYSQADAVPVADPEKWHKVFEDGTILEYDRSQHKLLAEVKGDIEAQVQGNVTAAVIGNITANVQGNAELVAVGEVSVRSAIRITIMAPEIDFVGNSPTTGDFEGNLTIRGDLEIVGNVHATGAVADGIRAMSADRGIYNGHTHPDAQGGTTGVPNQQE